MTKRRIFLGNFLGTWLAAIVAAGAFSAAAPAAVRADGFGEGARKFISVLASDAIEQLTDKSISSAERAKRFRTLMLKGFAIKGIAKFVLGRNWRKASVAEQQEYLRLFEDLLVATYAERFARYSGETLDIKEAEVRGENDALVHTTLIKSGAAQPIKVIWRVRAKGDMYKVVDIMVEGISMVQTQKSEFASFISQNGGKIEALLAEIRKRIEAANTAFNAYAAET